jgi:LAGLIDADG DNA endonuclease family protein
MEEITRFMKCGKIYKYGNKSAVSFTLVDFTDITNNLLPYLEKYPILGVKYYDYLD